MMSALKSALAVMVTALLVACSSSSDKLHRYVESNNKQLAGKMIGNGIYCDGMKVDADTVVLTYSLPGIRATQADYDNWSMLLLRHKRHVIAAMEHDKSSDPDGVKIILDAGVHMKAVFNYAGDTISVIITPVELKEALE